MTVYSMDPLKLAAFIQFYLSLLKNGRTPTDIDIATYDLKDIIEGNLITGTITIQNYKVTGLETMQNQLSDITVEAEDVNGYNKFCANIGLDHLTISTDYTADIAIGKTLPFYGKGTFQFSINDIKLKLCGVVMDYTKGHTKDLSIHATYKHNPIQFTGFLHNEVANNFLQRLVNLANVAFTHWMNYEPEKASCLISPIIQYFEDLRKGISQPIKFNKSCLKDSLLESFLQLAQDTLGAEEELRILGLRSIQNIQKYIFGNTKI